VRFLLYARTRATLPWLVLLLGVGIATPLALRNRDPGWRVLPIAVLVFGIAKVITRRRC
jgi:hypothetical protein